MAKQPLPYAGHPDSLPDIYACVVDGDCMEPELSHGSLVIMDKLAPVRAGDLVCVYRLPEHVQPGEPQGVVKRLEMRPMDGTTFPHVRRDGDELDPVIKVSALNPERSWFIPCSDIVALHRCYGPVERAENGAVMLEQELIDLVRAGKV